MMTAVNSVATTRLPLPTFSPRAVLMYSAAVGGEGVALQLREATPAEIDARLDARLDTRLDERLAIACHEPELLAELLHAAADIGEHDGLTALLGTASPDLALASDASDSLPLPDNDRDCKTPSLSAGGITTVSVALTGIDRPLTRKVRPKPASPNRQGPQQCQVCNKVFGNASALAKHKLTHSDERKYVCITCAKAFKRQDHLNGHMLTHRNKKPYECKADGCGKSYCDARSLRRHTENHHQPHPDKTASTGSAGSAEIAERDANATRVASPTSPARTALHSDTSNGSEKSSGASSGDSTPPRTPPAPPAPAPRPKPKARPKSASSTQQASPKCGSGATTGGSANGATSASGSGARTSDAKPVECNLCHRKFKNIPALNGHMRLHGGYFKKDSDNKKLDKKESTGPPLQTASVSVRALIEEKIISRRGATTTTPSSGPTIDSPTRTAFAAPAPPPLSNIRTSSSSPALPVTTSVHFVSPKAPPVVTFATNVTANVSSAHKDSTLIELLKKGNSKVVKRSASDPGQSSPQQDFTFRPELFGVSFNSDDGYFSPALNEDTFQFATTADQLEELASLEDYATVAASIHERSPVTYPSNRRLAAVLNSPLPESLADFGACHGGPPIASPGIPGYSDSSPSLSYGDSPGLAYAAASPSGSYSTHPTPSPSLAYPTPPASQDAQSPAHSVPRPSSPLTAAFFTATMSSQEEVEEALEEVLPEECRSLDAYTLQPSPTARRMMLNSEDPLLSSSPRDFPHQRSTRRHNRSVTPISTSLQQWQSDHNSLQVCVEGRDPVPAVFLSPNSIPASPQRRKRKASPAGPYRSRMRRVTSHYTPQPMLQPDRDGPGLYVDLISGLSNAEVDVLAEFEDNQKPQINIGAEHQADIPELCSDRVDLHRVPEQLLWDPGINDALDDNEVRMFMELAMCAAMPVGGHSRESALQTLGECGGDVRAATLRLMWRPPAPAPHEPRWTPAEVEAFLAGLAHYDKDFYRIANLIRTKDSKQCVQFYYFWKKVTKDYKTLYLRSWSDSQPTQGSLGQQGAGAPAAASPAAFDAEEYPCKICGKVFNKVKSRSAHMKSHRPLDAEPKRPKLEKPYEKVERSDDRSQATTEYQNKTPTQ